MIGASLDTSDLATRLDTAPAPLRDAIARTLDLTLRADFGARRPLSIDTTADTITATIRIAGARPALSRPRASARNRSIYRRGRRGFAEHAMALQPHRRLRVLRVSSASSAVSSFSFSDIRAALEVAAKKALSE